MLLTSVHSFQSSVSTSFLFLATAMSQSLNLFHRIQPGLEAILGPNANTTLLYNATEPLLHEAAIYDRATKSLYVSSNRIKLPDGQINTATSNQIILITRVTNLNAPDPSDVILEMIPSDSIPLANGGVNYQNGLLFTAQGTKNASPPAGLFLIPDLSNPSTTIPIVTSYFGTPFNSPNDVVVSPVDGSIYFTNPAYGFCRGIRNAPKLPNQVYRFDPKTSGIRAVTDGFVRPNGISFAPGGTTVYVTDTGKEDGTDAGTPQGPALTSPMQMVRGHS